jgi:hypothetical protein
LGAFAGLPGLLLAELKLDPPGGFGSKKVATYLNRCIAIPMRVYLRKTDDPFARSSVAKLEKKQQQQQPGMSDGRQWKENGFTLQNDIRIHTKAAAKGT